MINIGTKAVQLLKDNAYTEVLITCRGLEDDVTITNNDILQGTFVIDSNSSSGNTLEIGCTETSELTMELDNFDGRFDGYKFEGAELTVVLKINEESWTQGEFIVDSPPRKAHSLKIAALDFMAKFNKLFDYDKCLTQNPTGFINVSGLYHYLCGECGVSYYNAISTNGGISVPIPKGDGLTCHTVLSWVCEISGVNAFIRPDGKLQNNYYRTNSNTAFELIPNDRTSIEVGESDLTFGGVSIDVEGADGNQTHEFVVKDATLFEISGNELITVNNYTSIGTNLANKVKDYTYRPFSIESIGFPHLQPMDLVKIITLDGEEITTYITSHNYTLNNKSVIGAVGESETISGYASVAPFTSQQKHLINTVSKEITKESIGSFEQTYMQLNQLMANSFGYHETIVDTPSGGKIKYLHDKTLLSESTVVYEQSENGFRYSTDGMATWNTTLTADGNMILKVLSVVGLNAEWIKIGVDTSEETLEAWVNAQKAFNESTNEEIQTARVEAEQASNNYALALSEADKIRSEAYADGVLTLAEQKAIAEADQAVSEAKAYMDEREAAINAFIQLFVSDEVGEIKTFIRTDSNGNLIIGKAGNPIVLRQTNDKISFLMDGVEVAYFSNNKLYVTEVEVISRLKTGGYALLARPDGGVSFKWVGL